MGGFFTTTGGLENDRIVCTGLVSLLLYRTFLVRFLSPVSPLGDCILFRIDAFTNDDFTIAPRFAL